MNQKRCNQKGETIKCEIKFVPLKNGISFIKKGHIYKLKELKSI